MSRLDDAHRALTAAQDEYEAALQEQVKSQRNNGTPVPAPQTSPPPEQKLIDMDKITSIDDIVALLRVSGFRMSVVVGGPGFETIEHLLADDPETPDA